MNPRLLRIARLMADAAGPPKPPPLPLEKVQEELRIYLAGRFLHQLNTEGTDDHRLYFAVKKDAGGQAERTPNFSYAFTGSLEGWPYLQPDDDPYAIFSIDFHPLSDDKVFSITGEFKGSENIVPVCHINIGYPTRPPLNMALYDYIKERLGSVVYHEMAHAAQYIIKHLRGLSRPPTSKRKTHPKGFTPYGMPAAHSGPQLAHVLRPIETPNITSMGQALRQFLPAIAPGHRKAFLLAFLDGKGASSPHAKSLPKEDLPNLFFPGEILNIERLRLYNRPLWRYYVAGILKQVHDLL